MAINITPPSTTQKLVFIHHSCGDALISNTDGSDGFGGLGTLLDERNFWVSDTDYGWDATENTDIGSYTDIGQLWTWFADTTVQGNAVARRDNITASLYAWNGQMATYPRSNSEPAGDNDIVILKSCFPNSLVRANNSSVPSDLFGNAYNHNIAGVYTHTVDNCKAVYNALLDYFKDHQDKLFIVITSPPETAGHDETLVNNGRSLWRWLYHDWLKENAWINKNVYVIDWYNMLTDVDNKNYITNGQIRWERPTDYNFSYYPTADAHPNGTGNRKGAAAIADLVVAAYNTWQGLNTSELQIEPITNLSVIGVPGKVAPMWDFPASGGSNMSAQIEVEGAFSGAYVQPSTYSGDLNSSIDVTTAGFSGTSIVNGDVGSSISVSSDISGAYTLTGEIDSSISVTSNLSGSYALFGDLSSIVDIVSDLSGNYSAPGVNEGDLDADLTLSCSVSGSFTCAATFDSQISINASVSGDYAEAGVFEGDLNSALVVNCGMTGAFICSGSLNSQLSTTLNCAGTYSSQLEGELSSQLRVTASGTGTYTSNGTENDDCIDYRIIKAIVARLKTVTIDNNYNTDIATVILSDEEIPGATEQSLDVNGDVESVAVEQPSIVVFVNEGEPDQEYMSRNDFIDMMFIYFDGETSGSPITRYKNVNADITKCLKAPGSDLDTLIQYLTMKPYYYDTIPEIGCVCIMGCTIERTINANNPYQLS